MSAARPIHDLTRGLGRNAFDLPVAALAGFAAAVIAFAIPADLLGQLVSATGLPHLLAAAEPPLGLKARAGIGIVGAAAAFGFVFMMMRLLDGAGRRKARFASPTNGDGPRLRRRDNHPDAPVCRPISASRDLGEPAPPLPASSREPAPAAFEPAEPESETWPAEPEPASCDLPEPEPENWSAAPEPAASEPDERGPEPWQVEPAPPAFARTLRAARPRIMNAGVAGDPAPFASQPEVAFQAPVPGGDPAPETAFEPAAEGASAASVPEPAAPAPDRAAETAAEPSWLEPEPAAQAAPELPAPAPEPAAPASLPDLMRRLEQGLARRRTRQVFAPASQHQHAPAPQVFPEANDDRLQNAIESLQRFAARGD